MPPVVVDGSNLNRRWPAVSPGIFRCSFTGLGGMGGWVGLAGQGVRGICCYSLQGESIPGRSHGGAVAHPLCCGCLGLRLSEGGISELCTTFLEWLLWRRFNASAELIARIMCETGSNFRVGWHTVFGGFSARIDKNFILAVGLTTGLSFYGV